MRKLLRRPPRAVTLGVANATMRMTATASAVVVRGPFTPRPGQPLEDQIAELGALVNRLREDLAAQDQEHRQAVDTRSEEHTSELQSHHDIVCRLLLEKKKKNK